MKNVFFAINLIVVFSVHTSKCMDNLHRDSYQVQQASLDSSLEQRRQKRVDVQMHFEHLIRSHNFDEANKYVQEGFVIKTDNFRSFLYEAMRKNDYPVVSFLFSSVHMKFESLYYPAVQNKKVAKLLINQEITQEDKNNLSIELLKRMVRVPELYKPSCIRYIISNISNINMGLDEQKNTFLHRAVLEGAVEVVAALLEYPSIDIHKRNNLGYTPFQYAIEVAKIFENRVVLLFNKAGIFFRPIALGNPFELELCQEDFKTVSEKENFLATLFFIAQQKEKTHVSNTKKLADANQGIICDSQGYHFSHVSLKDLECCIGLKQINHIKNRLLERCAVVLNTMREGSAHVFKDYRSRNGSFGCLMPDLICIETNDATALVRQYPFTLFYDRDMAFKIVLAALQAPNQSAFENMVENLNPDLSIVDEDGNSLLHWAVTLDKSHEAKLLIRKGIDCFAHNKEGKTAFDSAQAQPEKRCFNKMIEAFCQACLHKPDYAKNNIKRYVKAGYQLNELKVLPYDYDKTKKEPLLHRGEEELCRVLLKAGVPADVKDSEGKTLLQLTVNRIANKVSSKFSTLIPLLLQYGAVVTESMVQSLATKNKDMHAMLLRAREKQEENERLKCCICFEVSPNNLIIPCEGIHSDRLCGECYVQIQHCPICRQPLKKEEN